MKDAELQMKRFDLRSVGGGGGGMKRITYMPLFGQQIYFVSLPSTWLNATHGVMFFFANFACDTSKQCVSNLKGSSYGANLLPVEFLICMNHRICSLEIYSKLLG